MSEDRTTPKKLTASELATVLAGWATALALGLSLFTFLKTYQAQEKFNEDQRRFNEDQRKFNEDQRKFNKAQQDALNQQAAFQYETAAVDAMRAYFTVGTETAGGAGRNEWLTNDAFFTAETLFNLRSENGGWRETAKGLILNHRSLIDHHQLDCEKYSPEFIKFVREEVAKKDPCSKPQLSR